MCRGTRTRDTSLAEDGIWVKLGELGVVVGPGRGGRGPDWAGTWKAPDRNSVSLIRVIRGPTGCLSNVLGPFHAGSIRSLPEQLP